MENIDNLSRLSHGQLVELARILENQESAYRTNRLNYYEPHEEGVDGGQLAFHKSDSKIRLVVTGNRWGKTTASVIEAIWLATGTHPYNPIPIPNRGKLFADSYPMIMENLFLKIQEWCSKKLLDRNKPFVYTNKGYLTGVNFSCGSFLKLGSYDQKTRASEGSNWNYIGFDEPPSRDLFVANLRGLVDLSGRMWFSMTPLSEAWIFDDLWMPGLNGEKKHIKCFRGNSYDNPHLKRNELDLYFGELTEDERKVRELGEFSKLLGTVISTYDRTLSDIESFELDNRFVIYEGIDPHPRKANNVLWKAVDINGFRYVVDELVFDGGINDLAGAVFEKRKELTRHGATMLRSVCDSSLNQDDMMNKVNQLNVFNNGLKALGETVLTKVANKKDWLFPGIDKLKSLYRPTLHIRKNNDSSNNDTNDNTSRNTDLIYKYNLQTELMSDIILDEYGDKYMPTQYIFEDKCKSYKYELAHYQWPENALDGTKPIAKWNELIDCDRYIESIAPRFETFGQSIIRNSNKNAYMRNIR